MSQSVFPRSSFAACTYLRFEDQQCRVLQRLPCQLRGLCMSDGFGAVLIPRRRVEGLTPRMEDAGKRSLTVQAKRGTTLRVLPKWNCHRAYDFSFALDVGKVMIPR